MILNELKAAAEAAIAWAAKYGNDAKPVEVSPATILKLIAVVEAARQWVGTAGPLYEAFQELEK